MKTFQDLIWFCLKKWYWFVISILLCCGLGILYYFSTTPKFVTEFLYHPRENEQGQMFTSVSTMADQTIVGVGNFIRVTDEQERLNSHEVMRATIQDLNLQFECRKKVGLRWVGQYPETDFQVQLLDYDSITDLKKTVKIDIKKSNGQYKIKVKMGKPEKSSSHTVSSLSKPIATVAGNVLITEQGEVENGKYRLTIRSLSAATDYFCEMIKSERVSDDNHILKISASTDMPLRTEDIIRGMVQNYNKKIAEERKYVAQEVDRFLGERIDAMCEEIAALEADETMPAAERDRRIAAKNKSLELMMQHKDENGIALVYAIDPISVVDGVFTYATPDSPKLLIVLIISFVLGFVLAVIALYIKDLVKTKKGK